jgi:hypothetical protein
MADVARIWDQIQRERGVGSDPWELMAEGGILWAEGTRYSVIGGADNNFDAKGEHVATYEFQSVRRSGGVWVPVGEEVEEAVSLMNQAYTILCITALNEEATSNDETARVRLRGDKKKTMWLTMASTRSLASALARSCRDPPTCSD